MINFFYYYYYCSFCKHCVQWELVYFGELIPPFENEVEFLPFWLFNFWRFFSFPSWLESILWWEEEPQELSFGLVLLGVGFQLSVLTAVHTRRLLLGQAASCKVHRDPFPTRGRAGTLPFLLVLKALDRTLTPQACQPQPQVGWRGHLVKDFPQNQRDTSQHIGGGRSLLEAPASVWRALPDLFGAGLPEAMPYWFCTNRVHLWVSCLPGAHFFLFSPSEQTGLKSSTH